MQPAQGQKIKIVKDGPYLVSGGVPLTKETIVADENGESVDWRQDVRLEDRERCGLCRCGESKTKPFCDGSHVAAHFDGTETASRAPQSEQSVLLEGPIVDMADAAALCSEARFCHRAGKAWIIVYDDDPAAAQTVIEECAQCPSGRYTAVDKATSEHIEPEFAPSIAFVQDPHMGVSGPVWVRGGIQIESADGEAYEVRNRVTLCRCGKSKNKPFCDGTHCTCDFHDGL
ncbi:MAG: iron-binding protein [Coriobacteriia bacterium]|nr:iron-binding protein [Coriobacteriia bacterium]